MRAAPYMEGQIRSVESLKPVSIPLKIRILVVSVQNLSRVVGIEVGERRPGDRN